MQMKVPLSSIELGTANGTEKSEVFLHMEDGAIL